jgi:hypothetical protein
MPFGAPSTPSFLEVQRTDQFDTKRKFPPSMTAARVRKANFLSDEPSASADITGGVGGRSIRLLFALRQPGLAQALEDALKLRVEGRIVAKVMARSGLHGEAGIDLLQLGRGLLCLFVMTEPGVGGREVDQREKIRRIAGS